MAKNNQSGNSSQKPSEKKIKQKSGGQTSRGKWFESLGIDTLEDLYPEGNDHGKYEPKPFRE